MTQNNTLTEFLHINTFEVILRAPSIIMVRVRDHCPHSLENSREDWVKQVRHE